MFINSVNPRVTYVLEMIVIYKGKKTEQQKKILLTQDTGKDSNHNCLANMLYSYQHIGPFIIY